MRKTRTPVRIVARTFFERDTTTVARSLLGLLLCHRTPAGLLVGRIVETEAYLGAADGASHAARGRTPRNGLMFDAPGHAYVYFSYGAHWCFNTVAFSEPPGAVLVRALEPVEGTEEMARRRTLPADDPGLTNGPGKLTKALDITGDHNGAPLFDEQGGLFVARPGRLPRRPVVATPRIGIRLSADLPLRFCYADSAYVSRKLRAAS